MFREARQRSTRKQLEKDRLDPKKSHKPEPPVSGPGNMLFSSSFFSFLLLLLPVFKISNAKTKKLSEQEENERTKGDMKSNVKQD